MKNVLKKVIQTTILVNLIIAQAWSQDNIQNGQWLRFSLANDVVFQTDKNYTNGIILEYVSEHSFNLLAPLHFLHNNESVSFNTISVRQDIFTPQKMNAGEYNGLDRPFASYLLVGSKKTSLNYNKKFLFTSQFEAGVLGKYGGGELVQNGVHAALPSSSHVNGWENQVQSDVALNYGLEVEKGLLNHDIVGISGNLHGTVGLPYTYLGAGVTLRAGEYHDYFSNMGFYRVNGLQMYVFAGLEANVVVYNATIQGGLFNPVSETNGVVLNSFVLKAKSGLNLSYKKFSFEIGMQQVSPEFNKGTMHRWGYMSFTFQL